MSPRERAARSLYEREPLYFHPARDPLKRSGVMPWEEADDGWRAPYYRRVDAVLDAIREPGVPALDNMLFSLRPYCDPMIAAADAWQSVIDAIKRGEG